VYFAFLFLTTIDTLSLFFSSSRQAVSFFFRDLFEYLQQLSSHSLFYYRRHTQKKKEESERERKEKRNQEFCFLN
jgi:hypothetical protein